MPGLSAPLFAFQGRKSLPELDSYLRAGLTTGQFVLTGPGLKGSEGNLPVRGDLAHIKLAGRCFVPHYAVPMPHSTGPLGAVLRQSGKPEAAVVTTIAPGKTFDVLDISGGWAWGQVATNVPDEEGLVGYIVLSELSPSTP